VGGFMLDDLQTGKFIRSAISSEVFVIFTLKKFRAEIPHAFGIPNCVTPPPPPMPSEFQSKKPPSPSEFQDSTHGMLWMFSGATHCFLSNSTFSKVKQTRTLRVSGEQNSLFPPYTNTVSPCTVRMTTTRQ